MTRGRPSSPKDDVPRLRLVAVVVDEGRVLITPEHDAGIWRLPGARWRIGENPNAILRGLLARTAGVVISPVLHTIVRVTPEVTALVFTATPIIGPLRPVSGATVHWLPLRQVQAALPVVERDLLRMVAHGKTSGRNSIDTHLGVLGAAHR